MPVPTPNNGKNPATNVVALYKGGPPTGGPDEFAKDLLNTPKSLVPQFKALFGFNAPTTIKEFVIYLPDNEKRNLMGAIYWPAGQILPPQNPNATV